MLSIGPSRSTAVAAGLLLLVALAGCSSLTGTESPTPSTTEPSVPTQSVTQTPTAVPTAAPTPTATPSASPTPTVTPSPSATATPTPTATPSPTASPSPDRLPAGLVEGGVRNVTRVVETHQANVVETPGVVTHTTNSTVGDSAIVATVRVAAGPDLTRVRYVSNARRVVGNETGNRTTVIAANGTAVKQYTVADGNVTLDNTRNRTGLFDRSLRGLSTATNPLRGALRRGNFTVAGVDDRDDATVVTLRADRYAGGQLYDAENVAAYNATVRITTDGVIRSATERIVSRADGSERRYGFTYEFEPRPVDLPRVPRVPAELRVGSDDPASDLG